MAKAKKRKPRARRVNRRRSLPSGGFPDKKAVRLKYVEFITLNPTAAGSAVPIINHFRANSLFDPNYSGVGHQPRGFDEHAALYDHYTVIGSKIKVTFESDVDHISSAGQYCFLYLQDTTSAPGTLVDIMEGGVGKSKFNYRPRSTASGKSVVLKSNYSPYKLFGIPKKDSIINNIALTPQCSANPSEDAIYTLGIMCNRTTTTDPPQLTARVEIEYIAIFSEKKPMQSS